MQVLLDRKTGAETGVKTIAAVHIQCLLRVIFVRSTRFRRSRHVRFAPIASEPSHRSDFDAVCHQRTNAVQQPTRLLYDLVGNGEQSGWNFGVKRPRGV
jgi:hypothetical protein